MKYIKLLMLTISVTVLSVFTPCVIANQTQLHRTVANSPQELRELFQYSEERLPLVSAHRGGAIVGYPENCIETFENTLKSAYSIMEIDLRLTKDGIIVLHHDTTLDRASTGTGPVSDYTLSELKQLYLKDNDGNVTDFRIHTLTEAINWARGKTILIFDKKDVSVERCVQEIKDHSAQSFVMIMVSSMDHIKTIYELDPDIMMEVFLGTRERYEAFEATAVPWDRIVPFISHKPLEDLALINLIHARGCSCIAGTSRYLDINLKNMRSPSLELQTSYHELLNDGIDIIETDLPIQVSQVLYSEPTPLDSKAKYFRIR